MSRVVEERGYKFSHESAKIIKKWIPVAQLFLQHRIIPVTDHKRFDQAFQDKRVLFDKSFGCLSCSEYCHVAAISERTDPNHFSSIYKCIYNCLVAGVNCHDGVH